MSESLTPAAVVEDNANGTITLKESRVKATKPALREAIVAARKKAAAPSTRDMTHGITIKDGVLMYVDF